jgi:hypothetical protein
MSSASRSLPLLALMLLAFCGGSAPARPLRAPTPVVAPADDPGDHAYALYKKGYAHILDEHWKEAHAILADVITKHARSRYVVDARYWSAYALSHMNRARAIQAYEQFLRDYPATRYYDDAVADLAGLRLSAPVAPPVIDSLVMLVTPSIAQPPVVLHDIGPDLRELQYTLRRMGHSLHRGLASTRMFPRTPGPPMKAMGDDESLDERTRLKLQTLRALGGHHEGDASFAALKEVALDRTQPAKLRLVALHSLSGFTKHDAIPTFVDVARQDPDGNIRVTALLCIGTSAGGNKRNVDVLTELFTTLPSDRTDERQCILDAVAETGSDKAATFLVRVARESRSPELQASAIDYLGLMDEGEGKTVHLLRDLYGSLPKAQKDQRQTILFTVADIGDDHAVDFLINVARSSDDYELRSEAVYYLGNIGGAKARNALVEILKGR